MWNGRICNAGKEIQVEKTLGNDYPLQEHYDPFHRNKEEGAYTDPDNSDAGKECSRLNSSRKKAGQKPRFNEM